MSWLCQKVDNKVDPFPKIMNEFTNIEPKTKQIFKEYIPMNNKNSLQKYEQWSRIKIETIDVANLRKNLKQTNDHYIDNSFPHTNSSIGPQFYNDQIQWQRVHEVVKNAVYSRQHSSQTLEKISINRKELQEALVLIARTSPGLYKQMLAKILASQGIYEFRLFKDGVIKNVVVDDYIPTVNDLPIFVNPVRQNQVYAILLEKAIAKLYGDYSSIPEDAETLMEVIFCGPVSKRYVEDLKNKECLKKNLLQGVQNGQLTVLVSKSDLKIRNFGLNQCELYHVINYRNIIIENEEQIIFELVSQSKLSPWNGKFSINDDIWKSIPLDIRMKVMKDVKENRSFYISIGDIPKFFHQLLILQNNNLIKNKQWIVGESENDFPSYVSFSVDKEEKVFLRVATEGDMRQSIILARVEKDSYEFIKGAFENNSNKVQMSVSLQPGNYVLCIHHDWLLSKSGKFYAFLESKSHIYLSKDGFNDLSFLEKLFISYEEYKSGYQKENKKMYSIRMLVEETGFAYVLLRPQNTSSKGLKMEVDHQQLQNENWAVLEPYTKVPNITVNGNNKKIIILKIVDMVSLNKVNFPTTAFKLKE